MKLPSEPSALVIVSVGGTGGSAVRSVSATAGAITALDHDHAIIGEGQVVARSSVAPNACR